MAGWRPRRRASRCGSLLRCTASRLGGCDGEAESGVQGQRQGRRAGHVRLAPGPALAGDLVPAAGLRDPLRGRAAEAAAHLQPRLCRHRRRHARPTRASSSSTTPTLVEDARGRDEIAALRKTDWEIADRLRERADARPTRRTTSLERGLDEVMRDLQDGRELDLQKLQDGVDAMIDSITRNPSAFVWLKEIKRKDNYAYQHALGCSIWAASFGRHLGLEKEELRELALGGLLFDVGKTRLPADMLTPAGAAGPAPGRGDAAPRRSTALEILREHARAVAARSSTWWPPTTSATTAAATRAACRGSDDPDLRPHHRPDRQLRRDDQHPPLRATAARRTRRSTELYDAAARCSRRNWSSSSSRPAASTRPARWSSCPMARSAWSPPCTASSGCARA